MYTWTLIICIFFYLIYCCFWIRFIAHLTGICTSLTQDATCFDTHSHSLRCLWVMKQSHILIYSTHTSSSSSSSNNYLKMNSNFKYCKILARFFPFLLFCLATNEFTSFELKKETKLSFMYTKWKRKKRTNEMCVCVRVSCDKSTLYACLYNVIYTGNDEFFCFLLFSIVIVNVTNKNQK